MPMVQEEEEAGIPEWVVTFGDMMSLLLTFFVMLLSMSEVKTVRSQALIESLNKQFGNADSTVSIMAGPATPTSSFINRTPSMGRAKRANTMNGGDKVKAPVGDYPRVAAIRPSGDPTQGGVIYFQEGSSQLTGEHLKTLQETVQVIGGKRQKIEIRGHTSARPLEPDSPYRNHWDLAYARCFKIMQTLEELGIDPKRIRIGVAAENEPVHLGYDKLLRRQNSRVEILMLDKLTSDFEGTEEERRARYSAQPEADSAEP